MLSIRRHEEINEELQQIHERLLVLTDEIGAAAAPGNKYASVSKAIKFADGGIEYALKLMALTHRSKWLGLPVLIALWWF